MIYLLDDVLTVEVKEVNKQKDINDVKLMSLLINLNIYLSSQLFHVCISD